MLEDGAPADLVPDPIRRTQLRQHRLPDGNDYRRGDEKPLDLEQVGTLFLIELMVDQIDIEIRGGAGGMDLVRTGLAVFDLIDAVAGALRNGMDANPFARGRLDALGAEGPRDLMDPGLLLRAVGETHDDLARLGLTQILFAAGLWRGRRPAPPAPGGLPRICIG